MAFGDPHKRVGSVEGLGNYHQRVTDFSPFAPGEKLDFKLHYGFINAGVASLEVNEADQSVDGKEVLQFFGFKTPNELFWNWQFTDNTLDETTRSYNKAITVFDKTFLKPYDKTK